MTVNKWLGLDAHSPSLLATLLSKPSLKIEILGSGIKIPTQGLVSAVGAQCETVSA
jgi:hypothetical protein